jgi:hypothetical protein
MNLGEKLKKTIAELETARLFKIQEQKNADMVKIRKERQETTNWLYAIRDTFVDDIQDGKVPANTVTSFDKRSWLEKALKGKAPNQDIWDENQQFWKSEGLQLLVSYEHDGVGVRSWIVISLKPVPELAFRRAK